METSRRPSMTCLCHIIERRLAGSGESWPERRRVRPHSAVPIRTAYPLVPRLHAHVGAHGYDVGVPDEPADLRQSQRTHRRRQERTVGHASDRQGMIHSPVLVARSTPRGPVASRSTGRRRSSDCGWSAYSLTGSMPKTKPRRRDHEARGHPGLSGVECNSICQERDS